jgi:RNA polymerase sigma factor (sigma-70 family)
MNRDDTERELAEKHLDLAKNIALRFRNIPGITQADINQYANQALCKAAKAWVAGKSQTGKGDFAAYAATSIWHALNGVYKEERLHSETFPYLSPSEPATDESEPESLSYQWITTTWDTIKAVRRNEAKDILERVMATLQPREKVVIGKISVGVSLGQIGVDMGISKQRVGQILDRIREKLKPELEKLNVQGVATDDGISSRPSSRSKKLLKGGENKTV